LPPDADFVLHESAGTASIEAYRFFYTRLQHSNDGRGIHTLLLANAEGKDASPIAVANLGIVAAGMGRKTLLVDANLHQPELHRLLQCPLSPGLVESLAEPSGWQKAIQATSISHLHLLPAGAGFSGMLTLADISAFESILEHCKETYDLILCAAPPVLGHAETPRLSTKVEATCLVLICNLSRSDTVAEATSALEAVGAHIVGILLTHHRG
jgi:Mrp family chromosome partitioning ATPase